MASPLIYRERHVDVAFRLDFLVENQVVVEIKVVDAISNIHIAQLLTYLRLLKLRKGLETIQLKPFRIKHPQRYQHREKKQKGREAQREKYKLQK